MPSSTICPPPVLTSKSCWSYFVVGGLIKDALDYKPTHYVNVQIRWAYWWGILRLYGQLRVQWWTSISVETEWSVHILHVLCVIFFKFECWDVSGKKSVKYNAMMILFYFLVVTGYHSLAGYFAPTTLISYSTWVTSKCWPWLHSICHRKTLLARYITLAVSRVHYCKYCNLIGWQEVHYFS